MKLDLINEAALGVTKGTPLEEEVGNNFKGEVGEVGAYLAMARQAEREGYPEVADVLKTLAWEEAEHAARFAELNGMISASTKENIMRMLQGEQGSNRGKKMAADKAKEAGIDEAHAVFAKSSRDEARHARVLQGLLDRYFA